MSKKHQNRLRELQKIKGMHVTTVPHEQSHLHVNVVTTSGDTHANQLHSVGAHALIRRDLVTLGFVVAGLLVALLAIYWLLQNTGLEGTLIGLFSKVGK